MVNKLLTNGMAEVDVACVRFPRRIGPQSRRLSLLEAIFAALCFALFWEDVPLVAQYLDCCHDLVARHESFPLFQNVNVGDFLLQ